MKHLPAQIPVTDQEVADLSDRIDAAEKVEQLYSVRYAVGKYAALPDMSLRQQELLMKAMKSLAYEFKIRSHFRNAADVYEEYLDYQSNYLVSYNAFVKDSLKAVHIKVAADELTTIKKLDEEIVALTNTRAAVSGLKQRYYSFGGFGAAAVLILTVLILLSRNRAISQAESQIAANRDQLKSLNKNTTEAAMAEGTVAFSRDSAAVVSQIISNLSDAVNQQEDKKLFQKEITALQHAAARLNTIIS
ncbi:MAG: hypothetical protein M3Q95_08535 [Bacteroidota bacterium]|nr:hypothetical protein [Bacteroidota bacterium]